MRRFVLWIIPVLTVAFAGVSFGQGDSLSIGPRFQRETSQDENGFIGRSISFGRSLPLYKEYPNNHRIKLPRPDGLSVSLVESIAERKSVRSFSPRPLTLPQLSALLLTADGLTHTLGKYTLRSAPSGGALYPVDMYVVAMAIDSLAPGVYHFHAGDSSLTTLVEGNLGRRLAGAALDQGFIADAPVAIVLTARFERSTKKYADRGYRYAYIEAGSICQNIYLAATALRLGTVAVGAFIDQAVDDIIGIDGVEEAALLIMPIGYPAKE